MANDSPGQGLSRCFRRATRSSVAGTELQALHTPGHSPGSVCWYAPELGVVFSGDTLFSGGPGRHRALVLRLPDDPAVDLRTAGHAARRDRRHTGHGDSTTIGDEIVHYEEWVARGH